MKQKHETHPHNKPREMKIKHKTHIFGHGFAPKKAKHI